LPAEAEVDCRSPKTKSNEGTRILVAAGPAMKNGRRKRIAIAKAHFPARGFKADDALLDFLASLLIFRVLPGISVGAGSLRRRPQEPPIHFSSPPALTRGTMAFSEH